MFKLTNCKSYGRDEYLYEASWDDKELTLNDFLKHHAGDWEGTPNRVYIFKKRYPFQKGVFVSSDYDRLDDLNVDELRPIAINHIYAVGGWGPIDYYVKLA